MNMMSDIIATHEETIELSVEELKERIIIGAGESTADHEETTQFQFSMLCGVYVHELYKRIDNEEFSKFVIKLLKYREYMKQNHSFISNVTPEENIALH